jgi:hypothetical protein
MEVLQLSPLCHPEKGFEEVSRNRNNGSSKTLNIAHPAYGGTEVLQLSPLCHPEKGFEEVSRNRNNGCTVEAWVTC